MVVRELLEKNPNVKIWLCPDEKSSCSIAPVKYECALTYEKAKNIPAEILNAQFVKGWVEEESAEMEEVLCVIWKNWKVTEKNIKICKCV